jgi:hypothetical protein
MSKKSPFFVVEELLSPLQCDKLIALNRIQNSPSSVRHLNEGQFSIVKNSILDYTSEMNQRYGTTVSDDIKMLFCQFPENASAPALHAQIDGWVSQKRKWNKTKNIDFIGIIPLKSFCDSLPIDLNFETYGGKLELINFNFSILPERGSMIVFPCVPNFLYAISPINFGSFEMIKVFFSVDGDWEFVLDDYSCRLQDVI